MSASGTASGFASPHDKVPAASTVLLYDVVRVMSPILARPKTSAVWGLGF